MQDLSVTFRPEGRDLEALSALSFRIAPGELVGIVGESGSGKSVTALAVMGLLSGTSARIAGRVLFEGSDLLQRSPRELDRVRGDGLSMVFQEPLTALNPVVRIGEQIRDVYLAHRRVSAAEAADRAVEMLAGVEIPDPRRRYYQYPFELSGGMRQRAMIAMALVCEPRLLIADEPTTFLDVTIQAQILELLVAKCQDLGTAVLLITHDLAVVSEICSRVLVMYAGQLVEEGRVAAVIRRPRHPYTRALLNALPQLRPRGHELRAIAGHVPSIGAFPPGCRFAPRCGHALARCAAEPQDFRATDDGRLVRCWRADDLDLGGAPTSAA